MLHNFGSSGDGQNPQGSLIAYQKKLFGTTQNGRRERSRNRVRTHSIRKARLPNGKPRFSGRYPSVLS